MSLWVSLWRSVVLPRRCSSNTCAVLISLFLYLYGQRGQAIPSAKWSSFNKFKHLAFQRLELIRMGGKPGDYHYIPQ